MWLALSGDASLVVRVVTVRVVTNMTSAIMAARAVAHQLRL